MSEQKKQVQSETTGKPEGLSFFEKYLVLWIAICIVAGILLSQFVPGLAEAIDNVVIPGTTTSIPIGICLFLMMYPAVMNLKKEELIKLKKKPLPIFITLFMNWVFVPILGTLLAGWLLAGEPQLIVAVILLHSSPCTAMVLVWGYLAGGNQEQNVVNTSINTVSIIFLYAPVVGLMLSFQNFVFSTAITVDWVGLLITAAVFIGIPIVAGYFTRKTVIERKGETWFNDVFKNALGKVAIVALLMTLVILFALNGHTLIANPVLLWKVSVPLLLSFAIVVTINLLITKLAKFKYREAIIVTLIGSSSHFEIAIATAITLYGVGSIAALGTTMGLFWEVPVMLSLVYLGKWLGKKRFWPPNEG
ncbi:MAG: ACR3 family arsenite efflux transporter [Candidatus Lokiarchaeota archaeon]|nr:ACR3 family arsenite efflux transporter [Candidatus Lokiarchaeota archaeon]